VFPHLMKYSIVFLKMAVFSHNSVSLRHNVCTKRAVFLCSLHIGFCHAPFLSLVWIWVTTFHPTCQYNQALHTSTLKMESACFFNMSLSIYRPDHNVSAYKNSTATHAHHLNSRGYHTYLRQYGVNFMISLCVLSCPQWETWMLHFCIY
jgi:hypothetical protein